MSLLRRVLLTNRGTLGLPVHKNFQLNNVDSFLTPSTTLNLQVSRGVKTTDTTHPKPIYTEDEKILKKVLDERQNQCEDLVS